MPVKLPGPTPTASRSIAAGESPAARRSSSESASTAAARVARSPITSPSRTSAHVATAVAVSNAKISITLEHDQPPPLVHVA